MSALPLSRLSPPAHWARARRTGGGAHGLLGLAEAARCRRAKSLLGWPCPLPEWTRVPSTSRITQGGPGVGQRPPQGKPMFFK